MQYPKGVKVVYDNGGKTIDRYTVYYSRSFWPAPGPLLYACVGMNGKPFHPQGFWQHGEGMIGRHNGRRIAFGQLPADCQKLVRQDLNA